MSTPILYLHGVGDRVRSGAWLAALNAALARHGIAARERSALLLVPDYVDLLREGARVPRTDPPALTGDAARSAAARTAYLAERSVLAAELSVPAQADPGRVPALVWETGRHVWGVVSASMRHVERYRRHAHLRHAVLREVLGSLEGQRGDLVVVAHSLGSLVALDLLPHLPTDLRVRRLVTLGSPAGWPSLHRTTSRGDAAFPYDRVGSWVNIHSPFDLVPLGRGTSALFPAAVDLPARLPAARHKAELYVGTDAFARVLAGQLAVEGAR